MMAGVSTRSASPSAATGEPGAVAGPGADAGTGAGHDRRPGRPRSVEADRAILTAALRMLGEHGFDGLTMEGVASAAGVGKATVYRRWPSKTDLVLDAIRSMKPMVDHPDHGDVRSDLVELISGAVAWGDDSEFTTVVAALMSEIRRNSELAVVYREQFLAPRRAESLAVIQRGIDRGELRPDTDLDLVLDMLIGAIVYRSMISGGDLTMSIAERAVDQVLQGIRAQPDSLA